MLYWIIAGALLYIAIGSFIFGYIGGHDDETISPSAKLLWPIIWLYIIYITFFAILGGWVKDRS